LIGEWNLLRVSLGIKILTLNYIGEKIILNFHWFMKDEKTIDWREGIPNFHWTRKTNSRRGHGAYQRERGVSCILGRKRKRMSV